MMPGKFLDGVALMVGCLERAGVGLVVRDLAAGMFARGIRCGVVSILGGELEKELSLIGCPIKILSTGLPPFFPRRARSAVLTLRLAYTLWKWRIQVLNIHGIGVERIGLTGACLARIPYKVFVLHSHYPAFIPGAASEHYRKRLKVDLGRFDRCVAVSESVSRWAINSAMVEESRAVVVANGIDLSRVVSSQPREKCRSMLGFGQNEIVMIQVGRFDPPKNQIVSIRAMREISVAFPLVRLLLAGDGALAGAAKDLCRELGLNGMVRFLGARRDIPDLLKASDLFLMPSRWEGLPLALLEAMANGLAVIGSDVPGIADILALSPNAGILVKADDVSALAVAIKRALRDRKWMTKAGRAGRELVVASFSSERMIDGYIDVFRRLMPHG